MPWRAVKDPKKCSPDKPWSAKNTKSGKSAGCHATRAAAQIHIRALYANVPEAKRMSEPAVAYLKKFSDVRMEWIDGNKLWVQIYPFDGWDHPMFSETIIDPDIAKALKDSFDKRVYNDEYAVSYEHGLDTAKGSKAAGWYRELDVRENQSDPSLDGLFGLVEFTETAKAEIEAGEWKFHSGEHYDQWIHPQSQEAHEFVFRGGAVTNHPWVKGMVPLNFSEIYAERSDDPTGVVQSRNGGNMDDKDTPTASHADMEHSDPGTGNPPAPREDERNDDNSAETGSRLETSPDMGIQPEVPETPEAAVSLDTQLRDALGLDPDADIIKAVTDMKAEVDPLREVAKAHSERKVFSEMFPEQAQELEEGRKERRNSRAKSFSESYASLTDGEGKPTGKGFPAVVIHKLEETHKRFSDGVADVTDLKEVVDLIATTGLVDYGEEGTTRIPEVPDDFGKAFAERVVEIQESDKLDYHAAVSIAAERHPDLYEGYRNSLPGRRR